MKILKFCLIALIALCMMCMYGCTNNVEPVEVELSEEIEVTPEPIIIEVTPEPTVEPEASDEVSTEIELPIDVPGVTVETTSDEPMYEDEDVLQEITIADNEALSIVVISLDDEDPDQYTFHIHAESLCEDNMILTLKNIKINSFEMDPNWSCTITPGSKINANVNIVKNIVTEYAMNHISTVEFTFGVCGEDGQNRCDDITCQYDIEDIIFE